MAVNPGGAVGGLATGAQLGSSFGPIGTAIGAIAGAVLGASAGGGATTGPGTPGRYARLLQVVQQARSNPPQYSVDKFNNYARQWASCAGATDPGSCESLKALLSVLAQERSCGGPFRGDLPWDPDYVPCAPQIGAQTSLGAAPTVLSSAPASPAAALPAASSLAGLNSSQQLVQLLVVLLLLLLQGRTA